jgi:hypothetical protein
VKREVSEGKRDVHDIYNLQLVIWKELAVAMTHTRVAEPAFLLIEKRRNGEITGDLLFQRDRQLIWSMSVLYYITLADLKREP